MVGVDTHRVEHVLAVLTVPSGAVVAKQALGATVRGYREALCLAEPYAPGARAWAIEGAGDYGFGLVRYLSERGETVLEIRRRPRHEHRRRGKDDPLDAVPTARAALASETLTLPRSGARREALRLLLIARRSAVDVREALLQLHSLIVTAPDRLRDELRGMPVQRRLDRCGRLRRSAAAAPDELAVRIVLRTLAPRIEAATAEANQLEGEILATCAPWHPSCSTSPGSARSSRPSRSSPGHTQARLRSEACFAPLAGVAPIPASSGQTDPHRLSRGGDRQPNQALHTLILHRRQHDPATRDHIARRIAEDKSTRDPIRPLKRRLARHPHRPLQNQEPLMT